MKYYFEKLQRRVDKYKNKYQDKPRKAAFKLFWWSFKCLFKRYSKIKTMNFLEKNVYFPKDKDTKELLIVNSDSIGDYILFRNFLKEIKYSEKYKDYKLVLLGCEKYKDFAEYLDSDIVDKFLWMPDRPQNLTSEKLEQIRNDLHNRQKMKHYYDTIVLCSFNSMPKRKAHNILLSEVLFENKIIHCDTVNPHRDCIEMLEYTHIFMNYDGNDNFEFKINKDFFEDLLEKRINIKYPYIENDKVIFKYEPLRNRKSEYIVINPCAYDKYRMWHKNNWAQIIRYLKIEKGYDVIIVCSTSEKTYCQQLVESIGLDGIEVWAGLNVQNLLAVLKSAKLYIGQDSGVFHIAAALNIRSLCISAGNAYFRFMNYPKERKNIRVLFPLGTERWIHKNKDKYPELVRTINAFYINCIRIDKVKEQIDDLLKIKDLIFVYKLRTENTGDKIICPYDYFPSYFNNYIVQKFDNDDLGYLTYKKAIFIIGGGGIVNQNDFWNRWINDIIYNDNKVIGWAIGFNQHLGKKINEDINLNDFCLLGLRDFNCGYNYLPCVSCLHPILSSKKCIQRQIGCIIHYENTEKTFDYPTMYNNSPFEELINFIQESEVIITNTYHIMYWSTLLGKKVILFNPFSNKFKYFKYPPVLYSGNLQNDIKNARTYPEALEECRSLNLQFFNKVKKLIEN